jgi:hypothetical protein
MKNRCLYYLPALLFVCLSMACDNSLQARNEKSIFHALKISDSVTYSGKMSFTGYISTITGYKKDTTYSDTVVCVKTHKDSIYCYWKRMTIRDDTFFDQTFIMPLQLQEGDLYQFPDYDKALKSVILISFSKDSAKIIDTSEIFFEHTSDFYYYSGTRLAK